MYHVKSNNILKILPQPRKTMKFLCRRWWCLYDCKDDNDAYRAAGYDQIFPAIAEVDSDVYTAEKF